MPKPTFTLLRRCLRATPLICTALAGALCAFSLPAAATSPSDTAKKRAAQTKPKPKTTAGAPNKPAVPAAGTPMGGTEAVRQFADEVAERRGLDAQWVRKKVAQARRVERVRELIMPPAAGTAKDWAAYRARFIEPQRIQAGLVFWRTHQKWLDKAQARWGVPPAIVVSIVGVETFYGRFMGSFRVMDALATLSFDFPSGRRDRSAFFRSELEEFLVLCQREGVDPLTLKGSYAGAMGLPQFMPSSLNRWAIDFDGDGHVNLHSNGADVVGSVAHYLASFGWQRDMPTHFAVAPPVDSSERALLLVPDIVPTFSAAQMAQRGAVLDDAGRAHAGPLALVELQNGDLAPSYVAGTENFYVVTRYNWSSYYALAVIELAQALQKAR
jgi:membrane-bound lytic murein transglycosylase B